MKEILVFIAGILTPWVILFGISWILGVIAKSSGNLDE